MMSAPSYKLWTPRMDVDYLVNRVYCVLAPKIRKDIIRSVRHGPPLPTKVYEDYGIKPWMFEDPRKSAMKVLKCKHAAAAMLKNVRKMRMMGSAAHPIPTNHRCIGKIYGEPTFSVRSFDVPKDGKHRMVTDYSQKPLRGHFAPKSEAANFCYNKGFDEKIVTMGFADDSDYAAMMLSLGYRKVYYCSSDFKGWFWQPPQHKSQIRYQLYTIPVPRDDTPSSKIDFVTFPHMGNVQGSAVAGVHCFKITVATMLAMDRIAIDKGLDLFSIPYSQVTHPEDYGLAKCPLTYEQLRERADMKPRIQNPDKWIEVRKDRLCRWRTLTEGQRMPLWIAHQDDILFAHWTILKVFEALRRAHKTFDRANILTSTTLAIESVKESITFCGKRFLPGGEFGIPDDKWIKYSENVLALGYAVNGLPLSLLLTLAGQIAHVMNLFRHMRPMFAPFTWYLAEVNRICGENKSLWKKWKSRIVTVPKVIITMVIEGWHKVYRQKAYALDLVKLDYDADIHISCDWCTHGFGAYNHETGEYFKVRIPQDHELALNKSTFGEFFTVIVAVKETDWISEGMNVALHEDNKGCIFVIEKFKSNSVYGGLSLYFGNLCGDQKIRIFPDYTKTTKIIADPLSRTHEDPKVWYNDFQKRVEAHGLTIGSEIQVDWRGVFNDILELRHRYPISPHTTTHTQPCTPVYAKEAEARLHKTHKERALRVYLEKYGAVACLAKSTIRSWFTYCKEYSTELIFNGIFKNPREKKTSMDSILRDYIVTLMAREHDPELVMVPFTMMKPMLCAPIFLNAMFGREGIRGSTAWNLVYQYESRHVKETMRLSREDYILIFKAVAKKFGELKPPFARKKTNIDLFYFVAGTLVLVLSCVLLYRYGNLLDSKVDPDDEDREAPLDKLIKFTPSIEDPETLIFSTLEKTDKISGKKTPGRRVQYQVRSSMLDPLEVIDMYAKAHGIDRGTLVGSILKPKSADRGRSLTFNSFTRGDYAKWLRQLQKRLGFELKSLGGKNLTAAIIRRSAMTYFASITSVKNVQALAGHKNIATTANIYVGLRDDESATLRAGLAEALLGFTQAFFYNFSRLIIPESGHESESGTSST